MNFARTAGVLGALVFTLALAAPAMAAGPKPGALELPGKRTATSDTYLNLDGSYTTEVSPSAINFRDASGAWQPIDTTLVPSSDGSYAVQNAAGPFRVRFKGSAGDDFVRFDVGGASYALGLQGAAAHAARTSGSSIVYDGALAGSDLGYRVLGDGIKETITLADAQGPATFRFVLSGAGGLTPVARTDGSVAFLADGASRPTFVLSSPWAADTVAGRVVHAGETHPSLSVREQGNGRFAISLSVDRGWLDSPARRFPVVVDPTVTITAAQDAEFETSCTSAPCQTRDDNPMSIGGDDVSTYAAGVQFDLTAVPQGATVSGALLGLHFNGTCAWTSAYGFSCPPTAQTIDALRMTAPWSEGSVTPQTQPSQIAYDPTVLSSATLAAGAPSGWLQWDVTGVTQGWVAGSQPNNGLLLKHDPQALGTGAPSFESSENDDASVRPRLDITYSGGTTPPPGPSYADTIVADGPVGYWKLGDLGTSTAADSSGLNHPGGYSGAYTLGAGALLAHPADTAVTFHNASFDGRMVTDYLYGYAGSAVTAETWVKATPTGLDQLVSRGYASGGGWMLGLTRVNGAPSAQFTIVKGKTKYTVAAFVPSGTLYLAGTYDGSVLRLYANGALAASKTIAGVALTPTATTTLGGVIVGDVTLDETAIYDHALTAAQVQSHYATGTR